MSFMQEAVRQWVWVVGANHPDQAWILSDYDSWERNPHYVGPEQPHPEDYDYEETAYDDGVDDPHYEVTGCDDLSDDAAVLASAGWGTDEDYGGYDDDISF
jgi:hypothetical protein